MYSNASSLFVAARGYICLNYKVSQTWINSQRLDVNQNTRSTLVSFFVCSIQIGPYKILESILFHFLPQLFKNSISGSLFFILLSTIQHLNLDTPKSTLHSAVSLNTPDPGVNSTRQQGVHWAYQRCTCDR
jgi:hypothetical protein